MTTRIFLIRHGESEWNQAGRYTGQRDVPLSALGHLQAERLAWRLKDEPLDAIYSSPLRRARDTAYYTANARMLRVSLESGLAEINHGLWEGLTSLEVEKKFHYQILQWRHSPQTMVMPQGESLNDVASRASAALRKVVSAHQGQVVAIYTHDVVLRLLLMINLGLQFDHFWKWRFENAGISLMEARDSGSCSELIFLNDTAHLHDLRTAHGKQAF